MRNIIKYSAKGFKVDKNKQIDNSERFDAIAEVLVEAGAKQPKVNTCMIL